ncbi:MAG: electron transport complex subunit RsxC [Azoarcus sp.]|jgi:electron transport complex protein RnfC|nr:electron transport complex subunit RsxC [Azoarcus sp.]
MKARIFNPRGGVKPDSHKKESSESPIRHVPLPPRLAVLLIQGSQGSARTIVTVGDRVLKGQCIGEAEGADGTAIHAPTSGTVTEIGYYPMAHPSGLSSQAIVIEPDGEERWITYEPLDPATADRDELILRIQASGIVGMGGAVFPSHLKARSNIKTMIINGAECEPWITCDDRLMRERAANVVTGSAILALLTGARQTLIGIEDNKPEAIAAMRAAVRNMEPVTRKCPGAGKMNVVAVPTRYPTGERKQLIQVLTGVKIPPNERVTKYGTQCFNVATAHAVCRALLHGEPMVSRIVTVTGNVERPGNYEVLFGMSIADLLAFCGVKPDTTRVLMGGPMMGFALPSLDAPVIKGCNCLIAASNELFPPSAPEQPCIRCGDCVDVCPTGLQPFEMYWASRTKNLDSARRHHIFGCMECGCCAYVCPAHIPLVDYFRFARSEIRARDEEQKAADQARTRFEFRSLRLEREKSEKAARLAAKAAETRAKAAAGGNAALIADAVERARTQPPAQDNAEQDHQK